MQQEKNVDGMEVYVLINHVLQHLQLLIMMIMMNAELILTINAQSQNLDKDVLKYQSLAKV